MRKIVSILVLVSMLVMLFSACAKPAPTPAPPAPTAVPVEEAEEVEEEPVEEVAPEPFTLVWYTGWAAGVPSGNPHYVVDFQEPGEMGDWIIAKFHEAYPEYDHVTIEYIYSQTVGGRTAPQLDALIAAGEAPNIYDGYGGRVGAYAEIAVNFDDYFDELQKMDFVDYDSLFVGDTIPMIHTGMSPFNFVVNATLIGRACEQAEFDCSVPEPWSIVSREEFFTIGEAIKALDDGSYLGCLFGQNPSSQHLTWAWFAQVGMGAFKDNEFTGLNTPETRALLKDLVALYEDGQFVPDAPGMADSDCFSAWGHGRVAFFPTTLGAFKGNVMKLVESGELDEPWEPLGILGIQFDENIQPLLNVGSYGSAALVMVTTPEEQRKAAVDFCFFNHTVPWYKNRSGAFISARYTLLENGYVDLAADPELKAYVEEYGFCDNGVQNPHYNELRDLFANQIAAITLGIRSPTEALYMFEQIGKDLVAE